MDVTLMRYPAAQVYTHRAKRAFNQTLGGENWLRISFNRSGYAAEITPYYQRWRDYGMFYSYQRPASTRLRLASI